ncbi:MAG: SDR family oxidoreductase [Actinobacteria bacterium]|nr:SDR family oxidoreductase [Actinomycetota bacterium]
MEIVTGSTGFIGNALVRELLRRGKEVRALVRSTSDISSLEGLEIEKAVWDIHNTDSLMKAFRGADTVYHLAAMISIMPGDWALIRNTNLEGTRKVIDACLKCGVKRLVYTSSIHALKETPVGTVIDENMPFEPNSNRGEYDRSKALASLEVVKAAKKGLDSVVVCPTGVLGPYDFRISAITQTFIDFAGSKMKITINGAYDFVDVRDVAVGHILAAEKGKTGQYYILSGERVTMDEMMSMLSEVSGVQPPKYKVPTWLAKTAGIFTPVYYKLANKTPRFTIYSINTLQSNSYISSEKASKELGYNSRPVRKSIEDTFDWFRENKIL